MHAAGPGRAISSSCATRWCGFFEGDVAKTALWFRLPNPLLGDVSPRDMIRYGRYARLQEFVVEALAENAVAAE